MIVESKILVEIGKPTISGLIYSEELLPSIMKKLVENDIGGIIQEIPTKITDVNDIKPVFKIINPKCLVDETDEEPYIVITCDVDIDETKITEHELTLLQTKPWRLSILGKGTIKENTNIVDSYDLMFVNIEIVDETMYNSEK